MRDANCVSVCVLEVTCTTDEHKSNIWFQIGIKG